VLERAAGCELRSASIIGPGQSMTNRGMSNAGKDFSRCASKILGILGRAKGQRLLSLNIKGHAQRREKARTRPRTQRTSRHG